MSIRADYVHSIRFELWMKLESRRMRMLRFIADEQWMLDWHDYLLHMIDWLIGDKEENLLPKSDSIEWIYYVVRWFCLRNICIERSPNGENINSISKSEYILWLLFDSTILEIGINQLINFIDALRPILQPTELADQRDQRELSWCGAHSIFTESGNFSNLFSVINFTILETGPPTVVRHEMRRRLYGNAKNDFFHVIRGGHKNNMAEYRKYENVLRGHRPPGLHAI